MAVCLLTVNGQESKAKDIIDIQARDIEPYLLEEFDKDFMVQNHILQDSNGCVGSYACYRESVF